MRSSIRPGLRLSLLLALIVSGSVGAPCTAAAHGPPDGRHWVGTWAAALVARPAVPPAQVAAGQPAQAPPLNFNNQTLRQVVRVSIGGTQVRAVFSNTFGTSPLTVGAAAIALRDTGAAIAAGSSRPLLF